MNTLDFIHAFQNIHTPQLASDFLSRSTSFISHHPKLSKTLEIGGMLLGGAFVAVTPHVFKTNKIAAIALTIVGTLTFAISLIAYKVLDLLLVPHHAMESHAFKPGVFGVGRLYYQGHVPVLELQSDDPYAAGLAHGYLLGGSLNNLLVRLTFVKTMAEKLGMGGLPHAREVQKTIKALKDKLLPEHLTELEGVVAGFNQWSSKHQWFKHSVTVDDLLMFHVMPDSLHFYPKNMEAKLQGAHQLLAAPLAKAGFPALGCTVVIDRDQDNGFAFGRNMDWPSFGIFGKYSLVINRKYTSQKQSTAEIGLPGLVGTLTGMNKHGLSLAMNVCSGQTDSLRGMPAAFFNRTCLERCKKVEDIEDIINEKAPLGSYHLSVADVSKAKSFHFYQGKEIDPHTVREWQAGNPLITTNCRYHLDGQTSQDLHNSFSREGIINQFFITAKEQVTAEELKKDKLVEASLALKHVNTSITTHTVMMYPQSLKMKAAFDNTFSASRPLQEIDLQPMFASA